MIAIIPSICLTLSPKMLQLYDMNLNIFLAVFLPFHAWETKFNSTEFFHYPLNQVAEV